MSESVRTNPIGPLVNSAGALQTIPGPLDECPSQRRLTTIICAVLDEYYDLDKQAAAALGYDEGFYSKAKQGVPGKNLAVDRLARLPVEQRRAIWQTLGAADALVLAESDHFADALWDLDRALAKVQRYRPRGDLPRMRTQAKAGLKTRTAVPRVNAGRPEPKGEPL